VRQQVEHKELSAADYFLVAMADNYLVLHWGRDGRQYVSMDDDEVNNFAVAQYLIRRGVTVYQNPSEVPTQRSAAFDGAEDTL
jgi:hypothetical protein